MAPSKNGKSQVAPLKIEYRSPHELRPYPSNARTHSKAQIRQITKSIRRFGFTNPVLISDTGEVIAGHARIEGAKLAGLDLIPTVRLSDLSEADRRAYILADNRLAEAAGWDREILAIELEGLVELGFTDLELTGFTLADIDIRLEEASEKTQDPPGPEDELPHLGKVTVSRHGDLWHVGPHRLLCGDAQNPADYDRLLQGELANLVITDPPYNVPIAQVSGRGRHRHPNFAMACGEKSEKEFIEFLSVFLEYTKEVSQTGTIVFVFMDWRHIYELLTAARGLGLEFKNLVVWSKTNAGMGSFYRSKHELIAVFKNGDAPHLNTFELGQHGRYRTNVWEYAGVNTFREGRAEEIAMHPTTKPVALVADAIRDVSRRGNIVLDPFAGSGTTIIAAEKTGRKCYALELDPAYCDVIVRRHQAYTGKAATLDRDGRTFEDVEAQRSSRGSIQKRRQRLTSRTTSSGSDKQGS
jgi:DNA modification methylase